MERERERERMKGGREGGKDLYAERRKRRRMRRGRRRRRRRDKTLSQKKCTIISGASQQASKWRKPKDQAQRAPEFLLPAKLKRRRLQ